MRLLMCWGSAEPEMSLVFEGLRDAGHEIVYWVGEEKGRDMCPASAIFHDHYDAWDGRPANAFGEKHVDPPPSAEMLHAMSRVESVVLSMMNKRFDTLPVDERKHIYYSMVGYWSMVLDQCEVDAVIFTTIPHTVYNYIVFELARSRGIATLCFEETWVGGRLAFYEDFWKGSDVLRESIAQHVRKGVRYEDLGPDMRAYLDNVREPQKDKTLWYMRDQKRLAEGAGVWMHRAHIAVSSPRLLPERVISFVRQKFRRDLRRAYKQVSVPADMNRPFVYFPLNFQPERTTSPQGDVYQDQILAIETLAAGLPEGWKIYVKEHPSQWWLRTKTRFSSSRYRSYYGRIARISGVSVVPIETSTFALLESAQTVATITGTAGWEALLRCKSPLVFGIPWYRDCPGVHMVRSVHDCKVSLNAIRTDGHSATEGGLLAFLKAFEDVGTRAHIGQYAAARPVIPPQEGMQAIVRTLMQALSRLHRVDP